ncbi:MAG: epoxyqueuosine reductase [Desulfobacterales bacterium]
MNSSHTARRIVSKARTFGASLAGTVPAADLSRSPSHRRNGDVAWPAGARTVIVLALAHPAEEPSLDWWDRQPGHTPGNRSLIRTAEALIEWVDAALGIEARDVPYSIEDGGIYLKDAAVVAGLGVIGRNNLLVTPAHGPRVRLRALLLNTDLPSVSASSFDPCGGCHAPCQEACPQRAFSNGAFSRPDCRRQMDLDEDNPYRIVDVTTMTYSTVCIKYCRACELACPVSSTGRG